MDEERYPPHYVLLASQLAPSVLAVMSTRSRVSRPRRRKPPILAWLTYVPARVRLRSVSRVRAIVAAVEGRGDGGA